MRKVKNRYIYTVASYWNGVSCHTKTLHGKIAMEVQKTGLFITAGLPHQHSPRVPDAPSKMRIANLWEYDVVELFLVGENKYFEVELGTGGHFLLFDFTAPRIRDNEFTEYKPSIKHTPDDGNGQTETGIFLPWHILPSRLHSFNAFVYANGNYLAYSPLPGVEPDFHQPAHFPRLPKDAIKTIKILRKEV